MPYRIAGWLLTALFACSVHWSVAQSAASSSLPVYNAPTFQKPLYQQLLDPQLGSIPVDRLETGRRALTNQTVAASLQNPAATNPDWTERGPLDMGGRVRSFMLDPNDPTGRKAWAGSVNGGLWVNANFLDSLSSWQLVSDTWGSLSVSCLTYDPSNPQIMYAGTGDVYLLPVGMGGAGIYKTVNGGRTWTLLSSTAPSGTAPALSRAFQYIERLVVDKQGRIIAATQYGIVQSSDGGNTWAYLLAPSQKVGVTSSSTTDYKQDLATDLEIGTDGTLYAAFRNGAIYRSTTASASQWVLINTPAAGQDGRVELALDPSTSGSSQGVYAVMARYTLTTDIVSDYNDMLWFRKSVNAGQSWSDLPIPAFTNQSDRPHPFTSGKGWYCLSMAISSQQPKTVYVGSGLLARSMDGGASWKIYLSSTFLNGETGQYHYANCNAFTIDQARPDRLFPVGDHGVVQVSSFGTNGPYNAELYFKNQGMRITETDNIAWPNIADNQMMLGSKFQSFAFRLDSYGVSPARAISWHGTGGFAVIDPNDPSIQLVSNNSFHIYLGDGYYGRVIVGDVQRINQPVSLIGYDPSRQTAFITLTASPTLTVFRLSNLKANPIQFDTLTGPAITTNPTASVYQIAPDGNQFFYGALDGSLYKVSGLQSRTLVSQSISSTQFPQNSLISSIAVGQNSDELLVTYNNFGVRSVWYTADGGKTWTSKDEIAHGLPDMPIWDALFNPANRKQVLLATELGVWMTNDITASNPAWFSVNGNMPAIRCTKLLYRTADGLLAAATQGRGIFTTPMLATYRTPTIEAPVLSATGCAGTTLAVSFSVTGAYSSENRFTLQLSDPNGQFSAPTLSIPVTPGSGNAVLLPKTITAGAGYQVRIMADKPAVVSSQSAIRIGQTTPLFSSNMPRLIPLDDQAMQLSSATKQPAVTYYVLTGSADKAPTADQIRAGKNGAGQQPYTAGQLATTTTDVPVTGIVSRLLSGTTYTAYFTNAELIAGCLTDSATRLSAKTTGNAPSYCVPVYTSDSYPEANISDFSIDGTTLSNLNSGFSANHYGDFTSAAHRVRPNQPYTFRYRTYYSDSPQNFFPQNISIWIDTNRNGTFDDSERVYQSDAHDAQSLTGSFTISPDVPPGPLRLRVRSRYDRQGPVTDACGSLTIGEAEDYTLLLDATQPADLSLSMQVATRVPAVGQPVVYQLTVENQGPYATESTLITSRPPQNSSFTGAIPSGSQPGLLSWYIPKLEAGAVQSLTFTGSPSANAQYITAAQIASTTAPDPDSTPGSGTEDGEDDAVQVDFRTGEQNGTVYQSPNPNQRPLPALQSNQPAADPTKADLSLTMAVDNRAPTTGQSVRFTITVYNAGGLTATHIVVRDTLRNFQFVPTGDGSTAVTTSTSSYTIVEGTIDALASNQSTSITFTAIPSGIGYRTNMAEIYAVDQADPDSKPRSSVRPGEVSSEGEDDTARIDLRVQPKNP